MAEAADAPGAPQKVCPHCGATNATLEKRCPTCGKKYKRRTVLKVLAILSGLFVLFLIGIVVLIGAAADSVSDSLNEEQNAHAITTAKFRSFDLGDTKAAVIKSAGKQPEDKQEFENESFVNEEPSKSSCIYYNKKGGEFGDSFQLCFDGNKLTSKNAY